MGVNKERILLWVEALESGTYKQGRKHLRIPDARHELLLKPDPETCTYCCLGVATEVAMANGLQITDEDKLRFSFSVSVNQITDLIGLLQRAGWPEKLWSPVALWYGFDAWETDPVVVKFPFGEAITAVEANDQLELSFASIAAGIRRIYLDECRIYLDKNEIGQPT